MPRMARVVVLDIPHHIVQRGNNRQQVFFVDSDRQTYLTIIKKEAPKYGLKIIGWCLMLNHVHLIALPSGKDSLAKALGQTHLIYTRYINQHYNRNGHLWQNRFYSCPLDDAHFWQALRYVEQNPVRAKLVQQAWHYKWSSAVAHIDNQDSTGLLDMAHWKNMSSQIGWQQLLAVEQGQEELKSIRRNTQTGHPLVNDSYLRKLEKIFDRKLRPLPIGRPPKKNNKNRK